RRGARALQPPSEGDRSAPRAAHPLRLRRPAERLRGDRRLRGVPGGSGPDVLPDARRRRPARPLGAPAHAHPRVPPQARVPGGGGVAAPGARPRVPPFRAPGGGGGARPGAPMDVSVGRVRGATKARRGGAAPVLATLAFVAGLALLWFLATRWSRVVFEG